MLVLRDSWNNVQYQSVIGISCISAKRLSHPCPAPLEVISCQFFFFSKVFVHTRYQKSNTTEAHSFPTASVFPTDPASRWSRWIQTCLSPQNFNQNKVQWDGKNVNVGKIEFLCYQSNPGAVSFCGHVHPKVSCLIESQQFSFFCTGVYLGKVESGKWNLKRRVGFCFLKNAQHKKK